MKFQKMTVLNMQNVFVRSRNSYWHNVWRDAQKPRFFLFSPKSPAGANVLIAGGSESERAQSICCAIRQFKKRFSDLPVIIISDSEELEDELIRLSENYVLKDEMIFSTSLSSNYEPLLGLKPEQITNLICDIAKSRGTMDCTSLSSYTTVVLVLISCFSENNSAVSIAEFLNHYSESQLVELATRKLSKREADILHNNRSANVLLRNTINYILSL